MEYLALATALVALGVSVWLAWDKIFPPTVTVEYDDEATELKRAYEDDLGYDICAPRDVNIHQGRQLLPTGIRLGMPKGYHSFILPTSGNSTKGMNARVRNTITGEVSRFRCNGNVHIGTIDNSFKGELGVSFEMGETFISQDEVPFIEDGTKVAQLYIVKAEKVRMKKGKVKKDSHRGEKGIGSTDK